MKQPQDWPFLAKNVSLVFDSLRNHNHCNALWNFEVDKTVGWNDEDKQLLVKRQEELQKIALKWATQFKNTKKNREFLKRDKDERRQWENELGDLWKELP